MAKQLEIELVKSLIGNKKGARIAAATLGLRKLRGKVLQPDNACTRGQINLVKHLVKVREVEGKSNG